MPEDGRADGTGAADDPLNPDALPPPFRSWLAGEPAPAYLLGGEGAGLAEMFAESWLARLQGEGTGAELTRWTVPDLERESPSLAWRSPSFFVRCRLFLLPDIAELKKGVRDEIAGYLTSPDPNVLLFLPCTKWDVAKTFSAIGGVRNASPQGEQVAALLARYAVSAAAGAGRRLPEDAALFLSRWVGPDFPKMKEEVRKLVSSTAPDEEIGEDAVREMCVAGGKVDPFRLGEALLARRGKEVIRLFREYAANAETDDFHKLMGAIAWVVRKKGAASKALSQEKGEELLAALADIDRGIKGESGLSPEQFIEIRLLRLLA